MNQLVDIILIAPKRNRSLTFKLPAWLILMTATTIAAVTLATAVLLFRQTTGAIARLNLTRVEQENQTLISRLNECKNRLDQSDINVAEYVAGDNRQRMYWRMPLIHQDVWSMGIGGIEERISIPDISRAANLTIDGISEKLEILKARCQLREKSLKEIEGQIKRKYELWQHIPSTIPIPGRNIGSGFGYRVDPITKSIRMHEGVDIGAPTGTPIYASADGIIKYSGWNMGYGLNVDIDHGYGFVTRYAHCNSILVKVGEIVKRGQVIALVGATGRVTCSHLHYEVHVSGVKVNPINYIDFCDYIVD